MGRRKKLDMGYIAFNRLDWIKRYADYELGKEPSDKDRIYGVFTVCPDDGYLYVFCPLCKDAYDSKQTRMVFQSIFIIS